MSAMQQTANACAALASSTQLSEQELLAALRRNDEQAFAQLVSRYHQLMLRIATIYVGATPVAEDVVQETWLCVLRALDRFEGRSSLKTWIMRILANRARSRHEREGRVLPFSALLLDFDADDETLPEQILQADRHAGAGNWASVVQQRDTLPEQQLLAHETHALILAAIETLPHTQQKVITLRDIEGWSADEVCAALQVNDGQQRVLLHRARARVRRLLAHYR